MITPFSLLIQVCGLSMREAAAWLEVRRDTVKSWSAGRNRTPDGVLENLVDLAARIDAAADKAVGEIARAAAGGEAEGAELETVEMGLAADDYEARQLGWPCVGAQRMVIALALARGMAEGYSIKVVPRGSTSATAAAADVHDQNL